MIARVAVHLPESLWLEESSRFDAFTTEYQDERLVIYPPLQCPFEVRPDEAGNFNVNDIYRMLTPVVTERVYQFVQMNGQYVKHANLLQVDFLRSEFNRESGADEDPTRDIVESIVGNIVARLRYTIAAPTFREFRLLDTFWTVIYLNDDGGELLEEKGLVRGRVHAPFKFTFTGIDAHSWAAVRNHSFEFQPFIWERLYLDAQFLLPEVGPALTLAISAIETATDEMIRDQLRHKPGEAEHLISANKLGQRLDRVAKTLTGSSLKDEPTLWNTFHTLRKARNAAAHEGTPIVDGITVNDQVALQMILAARPVLAWIESRMSSGLQSHREPHEPKWSWQSPVQSITHE